MPKITPPEPDHSIEKYIPEGYVPTDNDINFVIGWNKYVSDRILDNVSLNVVKDIFDIFEFDAKSCIWFITTKAFHGFFISHLS